MQRRERVVARTRAVSGPAVLAVALLGANGLHYVFTVVQSRLLGPGAYGALAALLGLVLLGAVPGLALQAVGARRTARLEAAGAPDLRRVVGFGLALAAAGVAAAPLLVRFLHLGSALPALALAACLLPLPVVAVLHGHLQGRQRWVDLAAVVLTEAGTKLVVGVGLVLAGAGVTGAMLGALCGYLAAVALALRLARPPWRSAGRVGAEALQAGAGILALWLLVNLDVVLARNLLPATASGLYAAGAVACKIAYWAPQAVVVVAYPRLAVAADPPRLLAAGARVVLACGAVLTAGAALAGPALVALVFGPAYQPVAPVLWMFAALGTALALLQLLLYAALAAGRSGVSRVLGAAIVAELVAVYALARSVTAVAGVALLVAGVAAVTARRALRA